MPLNVTTIDNRFFTEDFKVLIRSNKTYLLSRSIEIPIVDRSIVSAHRYDFYTVLRMMGIDPIMNWTLAFLNDIINPDQDIDGMMSFKQVDMSEITRLTSRQNTIRN